MCGITGFLGNTGFDPQWAEHTVVSMAQTLEHRGPDGFGHWLDAEAGVALAHRRLAVLDPSTAGHQPMISMSGRYVLLLNGEIYNHTELRKAVEPQQWRGHSDTESLLAVIERYGLIAALKQSVGMFALALWDRQSRTLSLARDRLGEKPLYYGWQGQSFLFASELKALMQHRDFAGRIDRDALPAYLRNGYIAAPASVYAGIKKLLPGSIATISAQAAKTSDPLMQRYWTLHDVVAMRTRAHNNTVQAQAARLEALLARSVAGQMVADRPLGALLSGGVDSSTVVALMQSQSSGPVRTFTIGFEQQPFDEAPFAKAVAQHLGTDHTELYVTQRDTLDVVASIADHYDEPFADSSAIPTVLVARLAAGVVTVCLSGDGGDELFGGYERYQKTARQWSVLARLPLRVRQLVDSSIALMPLHKRHFWRDSLTAADGLDYYLARTSQWKHPGRLLVDGSDVARPGNAEDTTGYPKSLTEQMMFVDTLRYLPDDILVKLDRAAMASSLETRVPLLDHRLVEFVWGLPIADRLRGDFRKGLLRAVLDRYVPQSLTQRPKTGFGVPMDDWLRGPLRDWAEALLDTRRLETEGYFRSAPIRSAWKALLAGRRGLGQPLWIILMFQNWLTHDSKSFLLRGPD